MSCAHTETEHVPEADICLCCGELTTPAADAATGRLRRTIVLLTLSAGCGAGA